MTSERMAQLLEDAIFTQEKCDALYEEMKLSPEEEAAQYEVELRFSHHEEHIRAHMKASQEATNITNEHAGYESRLRWHYLLGGPHPHDVNYSLDQWDSVD